MAISWWFIGDSMVVWWWFNANLMVIRWWFESNVHFSMCIFGPWVPLWWRPLSPEKIDGDLMIIYRGWGDLMVICLHFFPGVQCPNQMEVVGPWEVVRRILSMVTLMDWLWLIHGKTMENQRKIPDEWIWMEGSVRWENHRLPIAISGEFPASHVWVG